MISPLLVTSMYSFLYGMAEPSALARRAAELGYEAIALTDRNSVYGIPTFVDVCRKQNIRPILGTELVYEGGRAVLLAKDKRGFARVANLLTMRAEGNLDARTAILGDHAGLVVLTDDTALLASASGHEDIYALLSPFNRHRWNSLLQSRLPGVATGEIRFMEGIDRKVQRVLVAIDKITTVAHVSEGDLSAPSAVPVSPAEFEAAYQEVPEALRMNEKVASEASYSSLFDGFVFPHYPADDAGGSATLLRKLVLEGAIRRYGIINRTVSERIDYELGIIEKKDFSSYFLTVKDIASLASRTCGRGSAAASIVSFCLGITDVDPIRYNLYFDRFLNPGRKDPPDIDVDFAWDERDALLATVIEHYGEEHAARVANHVCFQGKAALRETARAYGMPEGEITAIERRRAVDHEGSSKELDESWKEIAEIAPRLVGLPRNLGVHSGGLIVVPDRLSDHVPIERSGSGIRVTVWDKEGVEAAGLVKIDLLGNRSLAVVRDALANLVENGIPIDEEKWHPMDDRKTIDLLARGDTMGVFYVESPAMRILQQKTRRGDFEHLVIHSSIIRPAANKYINEYVDRLNGKPWKALHPLLAGLFDESYGILCYQEDVSKAAIALAGFSASEADGIRKILAKKDAETRLHEYWPAFQAGARARGVDETTIKDVWDMMRSFSGYSFVKAHSASYAMLSFRSAYLRAHHPAEFMSAVISNHGGFYSTLAYVSECRRMGLSVLPPDVNVSELRCRGKGKTVWLGLELINSLGLQTAVRIVEERTRHGPYKSIDGFGRRVAPDRTDAEALVGSGGLDAISSELSRAEKLMRLLSLQVVRETQNGPELFDELLPEAPSSATERGPVKPLVVESERKLLEEQMRYLGTTLAVHPMILWPGAMGRKRVRGRELNSFVGRNVELVGWPVTAKPVLTSTDEPMEFVSFEDETAIFETVLFPEAYRKYRHLLFDERPLLIKGLVEKDRGAVTVTVKEINKNI